MKLRHAISAILATATLFGAQTANAGAISVDGGWVGFCFDAGANQPATAGCQNDANSISGNPFTFTSVNSMLLKITDAFVVGDTFRVNDGTNDILFTSAPGAGPGGVNDPDAAFASGYYSAGSLLLAPGAYSLSVFTVNTVSSGGAYLRVDTAQSVPEPASLPLVGLSLAAAWVIRRRRTQ